MTTTTTPAPGSTGPETVTPTAAIVERIDTRRNGLSLSELARRAGLSDHKTLSNLLAGKQTAIQVDTLQKIATGLGCTAGELLGESAPPRVDDGGIDALRFGLELVPHNRLAISPLNLRRQETDDDALAVLAAEIAARGILQNLIGRRLDDGSLEILAGGRRWRAVGRLIEAGTLPADHPLPVKVETDVDDAEAIAIGTVENVQRETMHPLDEADAFAALIERGWSTEKIAGRVGLSQRLVQKRLKLRELAPTARTAFAAGAINLASAQVLSRAEPKNQAAAIGEAKAATADTRSSADALAEDLFRDAVPCANALFDRELYAGETIEIADRFGRDGMREHFVDFLQFKRLQSAAIDALEADLASRCAFVERVDWFDSWAWKPAKGKNAGAVIEVNPHSLAVKVHEGIKRKPEDKPAAGAAAPVVPARNPLEPTKTLLIDAHKTRTVALQTALLGNPRAAKIALILGLLGARDVDVEPGSIYGNDEAENLTLAEAWDTLAKALPGLAPPDRETPAIASTSYAADPAAEREAIAALIEQSDTELDQILAVLVAGQCGSFAGFDPEPGDRPATVRLAELAGADVGAAWSIDEAFLKKLNRVQLVALWAELEAETGHSPTAEQKTKLQKAKAADLRADILAHRQAPDYVPPVMRFGTAADFRKVAGLPKPAA